MNLGYLRPTRRTVELFHQGLPFAAGEVMAKYEEIKAAIRAAGIVWVDCTLCDRPWPFPIGNGSDRDWHCEACARAAWAKEMRTLRAQLAGALAGAALTQMVAEAQEDGTYAYACAHANEVPNVCPCPLECGCRSKTCDRNNYPIGESRWQ